MVVPAALSEAATTCEGSFGRTRDAENRQVIKYGRSSGERARSGSRTKFALVGTPPTYSVRLHRKCSLPNLGIEHHYVWPADRSQPCGVFCQDNQHMSCRNSPGNRVTSERCSCSCTWPSSGRRYNQGNGD